jgi:hypothetical protein
MATRILSAIGVVLYLTFVCNQVLRGQAAIASDSTAKYSTSDAKYVAGFEVLPSQFDYSNEPYNQENTIQMNAWGANRAWNRGTSATRALNAQLPLFWLLATRPNMTSSGLRAG